MFQRRKSKLYFKQFTHENLFKDDIVDDVKLTLFKGYSNDKLFFETHNPSD